MLDTHAVQLHLLTLFLIQGFDKSHHFPEGFTGRFDFPLTRSGLKMGLRLGFEIGFREGFVLRATFPMLGDHLFALDIVEGFEFVVHAPIIPCPERCARAFYYFLRL